MANVDPEKEDAIKLAYNPVTEKWDEEPITVSIDPESFSKGAMRAAYKMKVWRDGQAYDYVLKRYIDPSRNEKERHEQDVQQMIVSKHYGQKYDEKKPPKAVSFIETFLLRIPNRPGDPYFACVESFIEGHYQKYNTNSGWVDTEHLRNTPHAFSHFSFEESKHELLIVDIQGVSDMYTDPQIHTSDGHGFGSGNLGVRGMALFLYTHECNPICVKMGLPRFELYKAHKPSIGMQMWRNTTFTRSMEDMMEAINVVKLRQKKEASALRLPRQLRVSEPGEKRRWLVIPDVVPQTGGIDSCIHYELAKMHEAGRLTELDSLWAAAQSEVTGIKDSQLRNSLETLKNLKPNPDAALHHLQYAAHSGNVDAMLAIARMFSDLPCDFLESKAEPDEKLALKYLELAAERGCLVAAVAVAQWLADPEHETLHRGNAAAWYGRALALQASGAPPVGTDHPEAYGWAAPAPRYELQAALALLYETGGEGLKQDLARAWELYNEAAEEAIGCMKGKLANKFYEDAARCDV